MRPGHWKTHLPATNNFLSWEIARIYLAHLGTTIIPARTTRDISPAGDHADRNLYDEVMLSHSQQRRDLSEIVLDTWKSAEMKGIADIGDRIEWATDGSMDQAGPLERRRCAMAVEGPIPLAAKMIAPYATIQMRKSRR